MALPASWHLVPVTGSYIDRTGAAINGRVTFTSSTIVVVDGVTVVPKDIVAEISDGVLATNLPSTDDPDISPVGWTYTVREEEAVRSGGPVYGLLRTPYAITVPHDSAGIDLATVAPVSPVDAVTAYVRSAGDTMTGPLRVNATGGSASDPIGPTAAVDTGIRINSSHAGGDDDGTGTDSTGRLNLYSYQRANVHSFGETIRNFLMRSDAKAMSAWYGPSALYNASTRDPNGGPWKPWVWAGAHFEANDHGSVHGHWEIEVPDSTGALQGRLEVPFIDQSKPSNTIAGTTIGVDYTNIRTNLADFSIRAQNIATGPYAGQTTCLRVGGGNDKVKDIRLSISSDMLASGDRWKIRANTDTESGSNAGTNLQILRCADDGTQLGTPLFIQRSDGQITTGAAAAKGARLAAVWSTPGIHGFSAQPTSSPGSAAGFDAPMTATTDRAYQATVAGDTNRRMVVFADGRHEWGDGANARDTNLYRSAADTLKTDDSLVIGGDLAVTGIGRTLFARKTADEPVTASNVLQDDDHLTVPVIAGAVYEVEGFLIYDGATTGDIKIGWTIPAGATVFWSAPGFPSSATGNTGSVKTPRETATADVFGAIGTGAGNFIVLSVRGILRTAAAAGALTLQWAQNASDPTATTVYTDSYIKATRVA